MRMENRDNREFVPPVRFRAVIEMTFPEADPWDPSDYLKLMEQWRRSLEESPLFKCKDVVIKEFLTIGETEDYDDWRYRERPDIPLGGIRITGRHTKGS